MNSNINFDAVNNKRFNQTDIFFVPNLIFNKQTKHHIPCKIT